MGKIYLYFGYSVSIYSDDHHPIHCHVKHGEYECKVEFIYDNGKLVDIIIKKVRGSKAMPVDKQAEIIRFCKKYKTEIVEKWTSIMVLKKTPVCEKITKKV